MSIAAAATTAADTTTTTVDPNKVMERRVSAVEELLNYRFKNKELLEKALTHSSDNKSPSYQQLEFLGDAVLKLAFAIHTFSLYPTVDTDILHQLCKYNTTNEKFARVAVRHGLYPYVRHNESSFDSQVQEFSHLVEAEDKMAVYGATVKFPGVLADIVESITGALFCDSDLNLRSTWEVIKGLLEPLITLETLPLQIIAFGTSDNQQLKAELKAAIVALEKHNKSVNHIDVDELIIDQNEIENAKRKLNEICAKKKWPIPNYRRIDQEMELGCEKRFRCCVKIKIEDKEMIKLGEFRSKVKKAENSAASVMIHSLEDNNII